MAKKIVVDPIPRIEGHLRIEAKLNDSNVIEDAYSRGDLTSEERHHLISEIRDVRAAKVTAGNEIAFRHLVQVCSLILSVVK